MDSTQINNSNTLEALDCISRQAAIDALEREKSLVERPITETRWFDFGLRKAQDVLSELPSEQPEIIRCKDCKHFHYDMPYVIQGIPVLGHEVCDFWGDGCKTSENGFCSFAEE